MQASTINEHKLHDLLGRTIVDFGGCSMAPLVVIGDRLGLYRELTAHGPLTSTELAARTKTHERYVREWSQRAGGLGLRELRRANGPLLDDARAGAVVRAGGQSGVHRRRVPDLDVRRAHGGATHGELPYRRRHRVARASPRAVPWHRAIFPLGLHRQSPTDLAPGPRRRRGEAARRRAGRRHRLRPRRLDDHHGRGVPEIAVHRLRLSPGVDCRSERARAPRRRRRQLPVRGRERQGLSGAQLRSSDGVRRAARHGRSGRCVAARADDARAGRQSG